MQVHPHQVVGLHGGTSSEMIPSDWKSMDLKDLIVLSIEQGMRISKRMDHLLQAQHNLQTQMDAFFMHPQHGQVKKNSESMNPASTQLCSLLRANTHLFPLVQPKDISDVLQNNELVKKYYPQAEIMQVTEKYRKTLTDQFRKSGCSSRTQQTLDIWHQNDVLAAYLNENNWAKRGNMWVNVGPRFDAKGEVCNAVTAVDRVTAVPFSSPYLIKLVVSHFKLRDASHITLEQIIWVIVKYLSVHQSPDIKQRNLVEFYSDTIVQHYKDFYTKYLSQQQYFDFSDFHPEELEGFDITRMMASTPRMAADASKDFFIRRFEQVISKVIEDQNQHSHSLSHPSHGVSAVSSVSSSMQSMNVPPNVVSIASMGSAAMVSVVVGGNDQMSGVVRQREAEEEAKRAKARVGLLN